MIKQELSQPRQRNTLEREVLDFIEDGRGDFSGLLMEIHAFQRENCAPYAAFCASLPPPARWQDIPALPLSAFRHAAIRCFPEGETVRTFRTSGTTGEGCGEHHFPTLDLYRAAALGGWRQAGFPDQNIVCLLPPPEASPHSSLSAMAGWLTPAGNFFLGNWEALRARIAGDTPVTLFGTALAFLDLFEWLADRSLTLPPGSLAMETGGYKGTRRDMPKADLHALFASKLGLPAASVANEYGMTELSSQFYTRGPGQPHRGAPWVRALVLDPETGGEVADGETGVLRIFDLANTGSCCAIQTRDLAVRRGGDFELIGRDPAALPRGCSRAADEMLSPN